MTINNLHSALELWDNGFNIIPIKSELEYNSYSLNHCC